MQLIGSATQQIHGSVLEGECVEFLDGKSGIVKAPRQEIVQGNVLTTWAVKIDGGGWRSLWFVSPVS